MLTIISMITICFSPVYEYSFMRTNLCLNSTQLALFEFHTMRVKLASMKVNFLKIKCLVKYLNAKSTRSITCIYQIILSQNCLNLIALILRYENAKNVKGVHHQKQLQVNIIIVGTRNIIFKSKQQFY